MNPHDWFEYQDGDIYWKVTNKRRRAGERAGSFNQRGYRRVQVQGRSEYVHRIVWFMHHGYWPDMLDHINRDKADNRIENLRLSDSSLNNLNRVMPRVQSSGYPGVEYTPATGRYRARIANKALGTYATAEEAYAVYSKSREKALSV